MTETKISSFKKGTRCQICTGCGRCFSEKRMDSISTFSATGKPSEESVFGEVSGEGFFLRKKEELVKPEYIIAADIGTTTIAMQLRRSQDGKVMDSFTALNPQRQYGADVLSRIEAAADSKVKKAMQEAVREVLGRGVERFLTLTHSCELVIAANTTMIHLLMGLDVSRLGQYPFEPDCLSEIRTELFGLKTLILPGISAFVGADIVAGIEALSMHKRKETALLLDLGTNGEMVLGNCDKMVATATAAGPAFEGNTDGYGADLMSLIARLLQEGLLDETGLLADPYFEQGITIGGVHITQQYIRQLQTAKAAVCTGIVILCKKYGLKSFSEVDRVYLAGGMGYFLKPEAAAAIGLLPQILAEKAEAVGNAALEGAFCYGRRNIGEEESGVSAGIHCEVFNLAEEKEFTESYIANMSLLPYEDNL